MEKSRPDDAAALKNHPLDVGRVAGASAGALVAAARRLALSRPPQKSLVIAAHRE
ncbi:MAG: hypothetical protein WA211_18615 [Candidatus Acidiferrales bacterium]